MRSTGAFFQVLHPQVWAKLGLLYAGPSGLGPPRADGEELGIIALCCYATVSPFSGVFVAAACDPIRAGDVISLPLEQRSLLDHFQLDRKPRQIKF